MANRNWSNGGKHYMMETAPVTISCKFAVDSTNANGLGISGLKGPGIANVYMTTSATKAVGSPGGTTGPAAGTIVVQLQDNYASLLSASMLCTSPNGTPIKVDNSAMTIGVAYVITTLGNTTLAQWQTLGVPPGVTPAVGVAFIASLIGVAGEANTSTSRVAPSAANGSEVLAIELIGTTTLALSPNPTANQGYGGQIILQCRNDSAADHSAIVTPANLSVIHLKFLLSNSSITVQGE